MRRRGFFAFLFAPLLARFLPRRVLYARNGYTEFPSRVRSLYPLLLEGDTTEGLAAQLEDGTWWYTADGERWLRGGTWSTVRSLA